MDGRARRDRPPRLPPAREDDDFGQAGTLVRDVPDDAERDRMVRNIVGHVSQDVSGDVQGHSGWQVRTIAERSVLGRYLVPYLSGQSREDADVMPQPDDSIPVAEHPLDRSAS
jgi:hypothetical protein